MDSSDDIEVGDKEAQISAALERLWVRFLSEIRARVEILEAAAVAVAGGTLSVAQRDSANGAAHKLAGTLGTFGLARGTVVARELEQLYSHGDGLDPEIAAKMARELREMVDGRTPPAAG